MFCNLGVGERKHTRLRKTFSSGVAHVLDLRWLCGHHTGSTSVEQASAERTRTREKPAHMATRNCGPSSTEEKHKAAQRQLESVATDVPNKRSRCSARTG